MIHVGIVGYGVIGRRVADAVSAQPDMSVAGIVKRNPDYKAKISALKGFHLYAADKESKQLFEKANIKVAGETEDLIKNVDVVVDASPSGIGFKNREIYRKLTKKAIYQGGESAETADISFVAQCNFDAALRKNSARVVSCNTTALCRVLKSVDNEFGVKRARAVIMRRATDPDDPERGIIDAVSVDPKIPSHHGPDVNTVLPDMEVITAALKIPTTHMHLHTLIISLRDPAATAEKVSEVLAKTTRVIPVSKADGFKTTGQVFDYARELGRWRSDLYEVAIWTDSVKVIDGELYMYMGVGQEAIVVPENIDAIRALSGGYSREESIRITNKTLNILK
jgi:glyceraldehyde-3-phosphate dehydrogenase (NAD(P))